MQSNPKGSIRGEPQKTLYRVRSLLICICLVRLTSNTIRRRMSEQALIVVLSPLLCSDGDLDWQTRQS
jgi:hypothetical protein